MGCHQPRTTRTDEATDNTDNTDLNQTGRFIDRLTYGDALAKVRCLGQALLDCRLSAERPLAILSGNSVEHLLLALAAQHVGVPYAPISPAYSLVSRDFSALEHVLALLSPGLVFVSDRARFAPALDAALGARRGSRPRGQCNGFRLCGFIAPDDAVVRVDARDASD